MVALVVMRVSSMSHHCPDGDPADATPASGPATRTKMCGYAQLMVPEVLRLARQYYGSSSGSRTGAGNDHLFGRLPRSTARGISGKPVPASEWLLCNYKLLV